MRLGSAEAQHVDVLAGDRADHVGAGHEDPALGAEDDDVGERRTVRRPAGRRAEHDGDLRHLAGGLRHRVEDLADRVQRQHALGEPGATGVPQPDDGCLVGERTLVGVDHHLAADLAHRPAHDGRVGAERHDMGAVDLADRREHPAVVVGRDQLERAVVEERRQPEVRVARVLLARELRLLALGGDGCGGGLGHAVLLDGVGGGAPQALRKAMATLWPPKPKELFSAARSPSGSVALLGGDVEADVLGVVEVDRRRHDPVVQGQHGGHRLQRAGGTEQVAGHRLGRGDAPGRRRRRRAPLRIATGLGDVALRRRRRVGVDVLDVGRRPGRPRGARSSSPGWRRARPGRAGRCRGSRP